MADVDSEQPMDPKDRVSRRGFLKSTGMAVVGGGMASGQSGRRSQVGRQDTAVQIRGYRTLGRTGFQVSDIGFGAGFFTNPNVLQVALDMGVNYIDTGEHYVNGQSERAVGLALKDRDRKSVFLTTKLNLSFGGGSTRDDIRRRFHQCLERLQTDYVDCLMIHMTPRIDQVTHEGFHSAYQELKGEGKVRFLGLSNHGKQQSWWGHIDDPMEDVIGAAAEDGRFDVALFVYNFLQQEQGERIIAKCKAADMGVTLMKTDPISLHAQIRQSLEQARERNRPIPEARRRQAQDYEAFVARAEQFKRQYGLESDTQARAAAIKFVLSNPDVHSVCPSINTFDGLETFVALSGETLTDQDGSMLDSYGTLLGRFYCRHACGLCEPSCPEQVPVNTIMRYNHYFEAHGREKHAMQQYANLTGATADRCGDCSGFCESACPYDVPVPTLLARAHQNLMLA
jgi:predicted aldo/keto reductase-like oxidoreductase